MSFTPVLINNSQLSERANPRTSTNTSVSGVWIITSRNHALAYLQCRKSLASASSCLQNKMGMFIESLRQMHLLPNFVNWHCIFPPVIDQKKTRVFLLLLSPKNEFHCLITLVPTIFLKDNVSEHLLFLSTFFYWLVLADIENNIYPGWPICRFNCSIK